MHYLSFRFEIVVDPSMKDICESVLIDNLAEVGFESFEQTDEALLAYIQKGLYDAAALQQVIDQFFLPEATISFTSEEMEDRNWNETWENEGFAPIYIDNQLLVYDAKHTDLPPFEGIEIGIDACQAFGTGTHQTTQMMLRQLLRICQTEQTPHALLDAGCGSGILGIAAAKLGVAQVVGYDIDEWSVRNTEHNALLNGVSDVLEVLLGDSAVIKERNAEFDVVMANINRNILLADMPLFAQVMKPQGKLLLSGFYESDAPLLIAGAEAFGLQEEARLTCDAWCCLLFSRSM